MERQCEKTNNTLKPRKAAIFHTDKNLSGEKFPRFSKMIQQIPCFQMESNSRAQFDKASQFIWMDFFFFFKFMSMLQGSSSVILPSGPVKEAFDSLNFINFNVKVWQTPKIYR